VHKIVHIVLEMFLRRVSTRCLLIQIQNISLVVPCRKYNKVENTLRNVWIMYFYIISLSPLVDVTCKIIFNTDVKQ